MKLNRILFAALIASVTGSSITSCSESFLDENLTTQYSTDRFKTQEGLDELVTGPIRNLNLNSIIYGGSNVTIWEWTSLPMLTM